MTHKTNVSESVAIICDDAPSIASHKNQFGVRDEFYSSTPNKNERFGNLTSKILNKSVNYRQGIHPKLFCRRWFGLSTIDKNGRPRFTEGQIEAMESEYGYREQCVNLLARLLKIKPNTIHRWGKGVSFDKIPSDKLRQYEIYLGYIDAIRVITISLSEVDEASLLRLLRQLEARK